MRRKKKRSPYPIQKWSEIYSRKIRIRKRKSMLFRRHFLWMSMSKSS
jgi:hypothetical protein